jgi:type I restriction enzyme S subunit
MDPKTFLANFATIADAPGGVHRLRDLVLDLALSGRLVPQDGSDEPAVLLLRRIADERQRLTDGGRISRPKKLPKLSIDFEVLPEGWSRVCLAEAVTWDLTDGDWVESKDQDASGAVRLVQLADVGVGSFKDKSARFLTASTAERLNCTPLEVGDVLIARLPDPLGRACLFPGSTQTCVTVVDVAIARTGSVGIDPRFLVHTMNSPRMRRQVEAVAAGTTRKRVSTGNLRQLPILVPPRAEQERIVAKVDELMGLCDELETRRKHRHRASTHFRHSALHALTEAQTNDDFRRAWERTGTNWGAFTNRLDDIAELREAMTQLAVEGRLVRQDANDEPAFEVLRSCLRRKAELAKAGSARSRSELDPVSTDELPYELPPGWALARLDDCCDIAGGLAKGRKLVGQSTTTLPYLRVANVKAGYLVLDEVKQIEVPHTEIDRYSLRAGDVLLTEGGDWDKLGRSAIWTGEIDPCLHQNHIFRARTLGPSPRPEWISLFTNSDAGRVYFQSKAKRTTNLASINMTELRSMPLPVPPPAEQDRILTRLTELTNALANLESALRRRDRAHRVVADCLAATA